MPYNNAGTFADSPLTRADANTIEQYNGSAETATRYNWYTNRTDASNYDRLSVRYDTSNDNWVLDSDKAGTGTIRRLQIAMGGTTFWVFRTAGQLWGADNTNSTISPGNGSQSSPAYQIGTGGSSTGFWNSGASGAWDFSSSNSHCVQLANGVFVKSNGGFFLSSGSTPGTSVDVGLKRETTNRAYIDDGSGGFADLKTRQYYADQTITAGGTTGNQTINKSAGTVNIAAAGTTVTVTNSLCSTSSTVFAVIRTNDSTATIKNVVPGSGSFVINLTAAATNEISIGFWVLNK
jgi:hypothetical protein